MAIISIILPWATAFLAAALLTLGLVEFYERRRKGHLALELGTALFLVRVPSYESPAAGEAQPKEDRKELIGRAEQLYAACAALPRGSIFRRLIYGTPHLVFELVSVITEEEIGFYVAVPKSWEGHFAKVVQGVYPEAHLEKMPDDYTLFYPGYNLAGAYLSLTQSAYLPLATYQDLAADPLGQLTNVLSKITADEGAAIQIVIEPNSPEWSRRGAEILRHVREGQPFYKALAHTGVFGFFHEMTVKSKKPDEPLKPETPDQSLLQRLERKQSKVTFRVTVRLVATAPDSGRAEHIIEQLVSAFGQFQAGQGNSFAAARLSGGAAAALGRDFIFRRFQNRGAMALNTEELAGIWHLALGGLKTPKVKWLKVREVAPPAELPKEGVATLGQAVYRGEATVVRYAAIEDRRRHLYVVGQTGTGKTAFLQELIRQDIEAGHGVGVIDPHGDLIDATLSIIPRERAEDVVVFEPADMERPVGLNMLEFKLAEEKDFAVQEMIAIFYKLFPPEIIGPMFEHYMRNAMLALMADQQNPGTLVEIPRIFTDKEFLARQLIKVKDPIVRMFWEKEWAQTTDRTRSDMLGYVVSKVGRFVENEMMRNIIGQSHSTIDLSEVMNKGQIFLANLSKGRTGEVNASLLGLILVTKLQMAALGRAAMAEKDRRDFFLYVDEFQNFTTDSVATILSEARKYRLNLIIAHQYIAQLEEKIRNAVFGNVGSIVALRVGAEDAEALEHQVSPEFTKHDLMNLSNYSAICRLMIKGMVYHPFRLETYPPQKGSERVIEPLKRLSKLKYGRPRALVEEEIRERARLGL